MEHYFLYSIINLVLFKFRVESREMNKIVIRREESRGWHLLHCHDVLCIYDLGYYNTLEEAKFRASVFGFKVFRVEDDPSSVTYHLYD